MGPVQFFAQLYAEYHTKSLVCVVGWNHVKFQHFYYARDKLMVSEAAEHTSSAYIVPPLWGPQTFYMLFRGLKENALSKNHFCCNLFQVQLCTDWTTSFRFDY